MNKDFSCLFNKNMTSLEARCVFFGAYDEADRSGSLERLKEAYTTIASVIDRREIDEAINKGIIQ